MTQQNKNRHAVDYLKDGTPSRPAIKWTESKMLTPFGQRIVD